MRVTLDGKDWGLSTFLLASCPGAYQTKADRSLLLGVEASFVRGLLGGFLTDYVDTHATHASV